MSDMLKIETISFGDSYPSGKMGSAVQNIYHHNQKVEGIEELDEAHAIGVLITREINMFVPLIEQFQFGTSNSIPKGFSYQESEDPGWFYVQTRSLEDFVEAHNQIEGDNE